MTLKPIIQKVNFKDFKTVNLLIFIISIVNEKENTDTDN